MKTKLYFEFEDSDACYERVYFDEIMIDNDLTEIEVYEAVIENDDNFFWCNANYECGCKGSDYIPCGKECKLYAPRNGKSGCCKHYSKTLYEQGEKVTLKLPKRLQQQPRQAMFIHERDLWEQTKN